MADLARGVTIVLGGVVLTVAALEGIRLLFSYRRTQTKRFLWMGLQRFGTALGVIFIIAELGNHLGAPLTYRTPLALCIFAVVLIAVVGIARDEAS